MVRLADHPVHHHGGEDRVETVIGVDLHRIDARPVDDEGLVGAAPKITNPCLRKRPCLADLLFRFD